MFQVAGQQPQHIQALQKANAVRLARAEVKRLVAEGKHTVEQVISPFYENAWAVGTMPVGDLIMAQHRWGRTRTRRFLASLPISEMKTIGALTNRQRGAIRSRLDGSFADLGDPFERTA